MRRVILCMKYQRQEGVFDGGALVSMRQDCWWAARCRRRGRQSRFVVGLIATSELNYRIVVRRRLKGVVYAEDGSGGQKRQSRNTFEVCKGVVRCAVGKGRFLCRDASEVVSSSGPLGQASVGRTRKEAAPSGQILTRGGVQDPYNTWHDGVDDGASTTMDEDEEK